jgi:hypothetical protein
MPVYTEPRTTLPGYGDTAFEPHYRIGDLVKLWKVGRETVRRLIKDEPDVLKWGFRRSRTLIPKGIRTAFRDDPEHHRSVATLALRLCKKCSASSRETCPERSGGRMPLAE